MATQCITVAPLHSTRTLNLVQTPKYKRKVPQTFRPTSQNTFSNDFSDITSETHIQKLIIHTLFVLLRTKTQSDKRIPGNERLPEDEEGEKPERERARLRGRRLEAGRISLLWYMKSTISYILRKARAFYNEFCCDNYEEAKLAMVMQMGGRQTTVMDPYFSIPVLPPNF